LDPALFQYVICVYVALGPNFSSPAPLRVLDALAGDCSIDAHEAIVFDKPSDEVINGVRA
jgi:hypothetical protein